LVREEEAQGEESNVGPGAGEGAESNESEVHWPEHRWQNRTSRVGEGRRAVFCGVVGF